MQINVLSNPEEETILQLGDVIVASHRIKLGKVMYYKLIEEGETGVYRLLNLETGKIMSTFSSRDMQDAIPYLVIGVRARITEVIPSDKLRLVRVGI